MWHSFLHAYSLIDMSCCAASFFSSGIFTLRDALFVGCAAFLLGCFLLRECWWWFFLGGKSREETGRMFFYNTCCLLEWLVVVFLFFVMQEWLFLDHAGEREGGNAGYIFCF